MATIEEVSPTGGPRAWGGSSRLNYRPQNSDERYGTPENFLEIEVCNPVVHGEGRSRYVDYEIRMVVRAVRAGTPDKGRQPPVILTTWPCAVRWCRRGGADQPAHLQEAGVVRTASACRVAPVPAKPAPRAQTAHPCRPRTSLPFPLGRAQRYSDFEFLRDELERENTRVHIPPLPGKRLTGNFDPVFIEERRKGLERFINSYANALRRAGGTLAATRADAAARVPRPACACGGASTQGGRPSAAADRLQDPARVPAEPQLEQGYLVTRPGAAPVPCVYCVLRVPTTLRAGEAFLFGTYMRRDDSANEQRVDDSARFLHPAAVPRP